MQTIGFIILRHVKSEQVSHYWRKSYECIRNYYPDNPVMIIDDNSDQQYIDDSALTNTTVVQSEFTGRGELLPYYYYLNHKFADIAVFIHDSIFLNSHINFQTNTYRKLWDFEHKWDQPEDETRILECFEDNTLKSFHKKKNLWKGCFGGMCSINHNFLVKMNERYKIDKMIECISNRTHRMSFERVIGCLLEIQEPSSCIFGDIHRYLDKFGIEWGSSYNSVIKSGRSSNMPIKKVWVGR